MCTNGFVDHAIQNAGRLTDPPGARPTDRRTRRLHGRIRRGRTAVTGGDELHPQHGDRRHMCSTSTSPGAPTTAPPTRSRSPAWAARSTRSTSPSTTRDAPFPGELLTEMDDGGAAVRTAPRPPGQPYDFHWHGLMGYNEGGVRVVGPHPRHPQAALQPRLQRRRLSPVDLRRAPACPTARRRTAGAEHLRPALAACGRHDGERLERRTGEQRQRPLAANSGADGGERGVEERGPVGSMTVRGD